MRNAAKFLYLLALRGEFNTVDKNLGCTVVANVFQFCHGQSPIQGHENGAQAPAGKLNFENVCVVVADHRNSISALHS